MMKYRLTITYTYFVSSPNFRNPLPLWDFRPASSSSLLVKSLYRRNDEILPDDYLYLFCVIS